VSEWKVRRLAHPEAAKLSAEVQIFVAPTIGRTMQLTGQLRLTKEEADELEAKLTGKKEYSADLTAEEYNRLQQFLIEWSEQDAEALYLAEIVRRKFGASVRRASANDQG
jgi:hypothetical protein